MHALRKEPTVKAPPETFTGDAGFDVIVRGEDPSRVRVNVVRFAPGARNAWHAHVVGQTVNVTEGVGRIQARGDDVLEIRAGDTIFTPPGEWHWHGAAPGHFMTHLAIWEAPDGGAPESEWGEQVSDAEYLPRLGGRRNDERLDAQRVCSDLARGRAASWRRGGPTEASDPS